MSVLQKIAEIEAEMVRGHALPGRRGVAGRRAQALTAWSTAPLCILQARTQKNKVGTRAGEESWQYG